MLIRILLMCAFILPGNVLSAADKKEKYHPVKPEELSVLIQQAEKVVVYDLRHEDADGDSPSRNPVVLYSSSDPKDISELNKAITVEVPKDWFRCLCNPSIEITLMKKGKKLGFINVYEGLTIGFSRWSSDARIQDVEKWLGWFDARKIPGPRQEVQRQREQEKASRIALDRWIKAMPASLRLEWPKTLETMEPGQPVDIKALEVNLAKEFPDTPERIRALMFWYGAGTGPWTGFPMYEDTAEEMLLRYPTVELVAAIKDVTLTDQQKEGAARLLAGWSFNSRRPTDNALIPGGLKQSLLEFVLKSSDSDKVDRARGAFEQK